MPELWAATHHSLCLLQAKFWVGLVPGEQQDDGYAASWQGLAAVQGLLRPPHCAAAEQVDDSLVKYRSYSMLHMTPQCGAIVVGCCFTGWAKAGRATFASAATAAWQAHSRAPEAGRMLSGQQRAPPTAWWVLRRALSARPKVLLAPPKVLLVRRSVLWGQPRVWSAPLTALLVRRSGSWAQPMAWWGLQRELWGLRRVWSARRWGLWGRHWVSWALYWAWVLSTLAPCGSHDMMLC